jgi:hypothetical protein
MARNVPEGVGLVHLGEAALSADLHDLVRIGVRRHPDPRIVEVVRIEGCLEERSYQLERLA